MIGRYLLFVAAICLFASCVKKEQALVLPEGGTASHATVDMGENYARQLFYDFSTDAVVYVSDHNAWDLAFETAANGRHVFMNGGKTGALGDLFKGVFVYNTHQQNMQAVKDLPAGMTSYGATGWAFDMPSGLPDATGIGDWCDGAGTSNREVYIIITGDGKLQKMRMLSVSGTAFTFEWAPLYGSSAPVTVTIPKDTAFNYTYFSFEKGITNSEPPKASWDIVFTHYRAQIYDNSTKLIVSYQVSGALINPYKTSVAADSTTPFATLSRQNAAMLPTSIDRDIIGYDWKDYTISTGQYKVKREKNYILHTRNEQLYKMHFLDFYNSSGVKGSPTFEYERIK